MIILSNHGYEEVRKNTGHIKPIEVSKRLYSLTCGLNKQNDDYKLTWDTFTFSWSPHHFIPPTSKHLKWYLYSMMWNMYQHNLNKVFSWYICKNIQSIQGFLHYLKLLIQLFLFRKKHTFHKIVTFLIRVLIVLTLTMCSEEVNLKLVISFKIL